MLRVYDAVVAFHAKSSLRSVVQAVVLASCPPLSRLFLHDRIGLLKENQGMLVCRLHCAVDTQ